MKTILTALAFMTMPVLANPITDAVKDQAWPVYDCVLDVNGTNVQTSTDNTQYMKYSIDVGTELFTYTISEGNILLLLVQNKTIGTGYLYKGNDIVGIFKGTCTESKK